MCIYFVQQTVEAWRTVFFVAAGVYAFGTIFYGLFGSGEIQPWAALDNVMYGIKPTENETEHDNNYLTDATVDSLPTKQNVCCDEDLCTKL